MITLNLEQFSAHLQQLNFNLLFTDVLGWNHPPAGERIWRDDAAKDISYGLTEAEFAHIFTTFPLVTEPVKVAALNAYRDVEMGLVK